MLFLYLKAIDYLVKKTLIHQSELRTCTKVVLFKPVFIPFALDSRIILRFPVYSLSSLSIAPVHLHPTKYVQRYHE
jgi:hypothetical protein